MARKNPNAAPKTRLNKESRKIIRIFLKERMDTYFEEKDKNLPSREKAVDHLKVMLDKEFPESEMGILKKWGEGCLTNQLYLVFYLDNMLRSQAEDRIKTIKNVYEKHCKIGDYSGRYQIHFNMKEFRRLFDKWTHGRHGYTELSFSSSKMQEEKAFFDILLYQMDYEKLMLKKEKRMEAYELLISRTVFFEDLLEVWPEIIILANDVHIRMPERLPVRFEESVMKIIDEDLIERGIQKSFTPTREIE